MAISCPAMSSRWRSATPTTSSIASGHAAQAFQQDPVGPHAPRPSRGPGHVCVLGTNWPAPATPPEGQHRPSILFIELFIAMRVIIAWFAPERVNASTSQPPAASAPATPAPRAAALGQSPPAPGRGRHPATRSAAVSSAGSISRRSNGASVSVSKRRNGRSPPGSSRPAAPAAGSPAGCHSRPARNSPARWTGSCPARAAPGAPARQADRPLVHRQVAADAVAGAVVVIQPGLPQRVAGERVQMRAADAVRETPASRWRCGPSAPG